MLPGSIDAKLVPKVRVCDNTNEIVMKHDGIFLNALEDMRECNLKRGVNSLDDIKEGSTCHVYCAQSTCSAAIQYMNSHADVFAKCDAINYMHRGSIDIQEDSLVDGQACHASIKAYNRAQSTK